jgi:hypothetical protein
MIHNYVYQRVIWLVAKQMGGFIHAFIFCVCFFGCTGTAPDVMTCPAENDKKNEEVKNEGSGQGRR